MSDANPLGITSEFVAARELGEEVLEKLKFIDGLDLSYQTDVAVRQGVAPDLVAIVEKEFKRFLSLALLFPDAGVPPTPSRVVDHLWHAFILDTPRYREFCDRVYGNYYDHVVMEGGRSGFVDSPEFQGTKRAIAEAFGGLEERVWEDTSVCSGTCFGDDDSSWPSGEGNQ